MRSLHRLLVVAWMVAVVWAVPALGRDRPNVLWITSEDNGPHLGCYGDPDAVTPQLDRLASRSLRYANAWSAAPVCAPARTAIITGVYPVSTGAEHMRSEVGMPAWMKMFPQFLREAGYYCSNNSKEDYNLIKPAGVWDESSNKAHWTNRAPGQPFFAVFNHTITHESQLRNRIEDRDRIHDPARVRLPAYHPDVPEVRRDWARYHDRMTMMDTLAGRNLRELEEAGLAEETIVFYFGDHGSGMPRSKRWPYNSGLHVPLIVHFPEKWRHLAPKQYREGGTSDRLVGFVDLAPTMLSLAGIKPPAWMQGRAFAGRFEAAPSRYLHGFRGRMDERIDLVRSVRDSRFVYIRNYMPHRIYGQHIEYMFETPTTRVWKALYEAGRLQPPKTFFWETKPAEELYDLALDPDEVRNLAGSPDHQAVLQRLRRAQRQWSREVRDLGFLPENEMHSRAAQGDPYTLGRDRQRYPLERVMGMAERAAGFDEAAIPHLIRGLRDRDGAVRFWAATGLLIRGESAVARAGEALRERLADEAPAPRLVAAEAVGRHGTAADVEAALKVLMDSAGVTPHGLYTTLLALNALDALGPKAASVTNRVAQLPSTRSDLPAKLNGYAPRLVESIVAPKR